jgi:DNA-directed RNA polymerase specialized sigma24 family protein
MKKINRHATAAAIRPQGAAPERFSPLVHHLLDGVARQALAGKRAAIDLLAHALRPDMVEHAQAHLGRFDCDAEDVVQDVFLALLEGHLPPAPQGESAVRWLLQIIESNARRSR